MLHQSTKEAIKVGLAVALSITAAFWLGWDKAYWAVITVFMIAATESYSHAIAKSRNRILGTLVGSVYAIFLLGSFAQNYILFITFYTLFLAFCVFMSSHKKFGYAFTMAFTVNVIVACSGGFNGDYSFSLAILRIQETLLGVLSYSFIFRFIWPIKTEDIFFDLFSSVTHKIKKTIALQGNNSEEQDTLVVDQNPELLVQLQKLHEMLNLPLLDSPRLAHERKYWRFSLNSIEKLNSLLQDKTQGKNIDESDLDKGVSLFSESLLSPKSSYTELQQWYTYENKKDHVTLNVQNHFNIPLRQRLKNVFKAVSVLVTCLIIWIYFPIPGGYIMPLIASIYANVLAEHSNKVVNLSALAMVAGCIIFTAQYVFLMPTLTEIWQLAGLYALNAFFIWKGCSTPSLAPLRLLGGNFLVILTMGALQLTPSYQVESSLLMIPLFYICLAVTYFYNKLYQVN
jgi:hypothetical protein